VTSSRQIEANRENAARSTGPVTQEGKQRSRRNAVRHGLTSETVIAPLENAEDYRAFQSSVTADFSPETAVERELVLRLASLFWRLRRASAIETGLFEISSETTSDRDQSNGASPGNAVLRLSKFRRPAAPDSLGADSLQGRTHLPEGPCEGPSATRLPSSEIDRAGLAGRFLGLALADNGAFERLGRYETTLWRQACQIIFTLDVMRRQNLDTKWMYRRSYRAKHFGLPRPDFSNR
jgi:hypothetical protein